METSRSLLYLVVEDFPCFLTFPLCIGVSQKGKVCGLRDIHYHEGFDVNVYHEISKPK